jgi:hypothetical protein
MAASVEAMPIPNATNTITMRILVVRFPGALVAVDEDGRCADADAAILTVVLESAVTRMDNKVRRILIVSFISSGWWVVDHAFEESEESPSLMRFFGEVGKFAAVRTRKSLYMKLFGTIVGGSRCIINTVITSQYNELNHPSPMSSDLAP